MFIFFEVCHVPGNSTICKNKSHIFDAFFGGGGGAYRFPFSVSVDA
jgi:hypothetical protein